MLPAPASVRKHTATHHAHLDNNNTPQRNAQSCKRPASMIFRIEHLLPTATATAPAINTPAGARTARDHKRARPSNLQPHSHSHAHAHAHSHARAGVYVAQFTPKDTLSEAVHTQSLLSLPAGDQQHCTRAYCSFIGTDPDVLCMTATILRRIKLSEDIPSYNALFELHNGCVRLRTVRDIARDDELVAWFGEETTLLMAIPFLTPLNIQGNNRYTCHLCRLTFETPNPLKIHLALGCGRHSIDILWIRLHYALQAATHLPPLMPASVTPITSTTSTISTAASISPPVTSRPPPSPTTSHSLHPPPPAPPSSQTSQSSSSHTQRFSAFKPIQTPSTQADPRILQSSLHSTMPTSITLTPSTLRLTTVPYTTATTTTAVTSHSALSFLPSLSSVALPSFSLLHPTSSGNPLNAAAQIEAIVSNMGASKQGHLCIYCGKVYSRKYGLKIHIRTHTGFKPLKCKFCLRPFGDPSNLNKHVRLHLQSGVGSSATTAEGYKCNLCHKILARRRDLQRHMESRHATTVPLTQTVPEQKKRP